MYTRLMAAFTLAVFQTVNAAPTNLGLTVADGHLGGSGAEVLRMELKHSQFVLFGEDHGFADSPIVLRAIAHEARPLGFQTLIVEVGPIETQIVASTLAHKGLPGLSELVTKLPLAVPFLSLKEDAELASDFLNKDANGGLHLWGIDQEFIGAPALLLERLAVLAPDASARAHAETLLATERASASKLDMAQFFLFATSDAEFATLATEFKGVPEAERLIGSLRESAAIYQLYNAGKNYASNARRSKLLVATFLKDYRAADQREPKAIFKMGAEHLGLGLTANNTFDPGTLASGIAMLNGQNALRILFLPMGGKHSVFSPAPGNPYKTEAYADDDARDFFAAIGIDAAALGREGWTLIPLAPIRETLDGDGLGKLKPMTKFLLLGYDYVITTPNAIEATPLYNSNLPHAR